MIHRGTYDGTIYHNPVNKFCIISVKTADKEVPQEARSTRRYRDHLIRFVATGYELPRTDAVELELDGEWTKGKYGVQLQVEQWREIVPKTKDGVEGYLASGLIKGIGPATAAQIVSRFGVETLDILQNHPERLLEVKGITESKLEDIKTSYAESRMLQDLMTLLSPFKITPKTALKIYQHFGPASVDILKKSPFELCQVSGFGFLRVDAIVQKNGGDLHDPMRVKGALFWALEDSKGGKGHLFLPGETLRKEALRLLNAKIPVPSLRLHEQEVADVLQDMILHGEVVSVKDNIYLPRTFAQEDETARRIAMRLIEPSAPERIEQALEQVKREMGLVLSSKQEAAVYAAYRHSLSIITGSPGTGKTTVLKTILEVYRRLHPKGEIVLMAPTGRASRRMAESTGFDKARTLHSGLGLGSEEDDANRSRQQEPLSADLIIVDEFSMVDMWLADKFFSRIKDGARVVLVGDPDQLPSVGAGTVFRELIDCGLIPVTVLDQIFRQSKDSLIAYNAKFINEGNTKLYFGPDFVFMASDNQAEAAERIIARYCREIAESGIDRVQILSPFRSEGAASAEQLNEAIREVVNPFRSAEEEIKIGVKVFRVNDRIMQTKNTAKVSNGDLGFIRYIKDDEDGKRVGLDFGVGRELEYSVEDTVGGIDGQTFGRPGTCGIRSIKHIAKTPPLVNKLMDHHFAGAATLICISKIICGEVCFVKQAGAVRGIAAASYPALDELESFTCSKRQRTIVLGTIVHHRFNRLYCTRSFHNRLVFAAVVELNGYAASLNILTNIIAGIKDAASAIGLITPGPSAVVVLRNHLRFAGAERDRSHGRRQRNFNGGRVSIFARHNIHQARGKSRVLQTQIFCADLFAALHRGHIAALLRKTTVFHDQLRLFIGRKGHFQHGLIVLLVLAHREGYICAVHLHIGDGISGIDAKGHILLLTRSVLELIGCRAGKRTGGSIGEHLGAASSANYIFCVGHFIKSHRHFVRIALVNQRLCGISSAGAD